MRKTIPFLMLLLSVMMAKPAEAQYLINQTSYTPINFTSRTENVSLYLQDGSTFEGIKHITFANGNVHSVSYRGTLRKPSGERYISGTSGGGFDANFNLTGFIWYIATDGNIFRQVYKNGYCQSSEREYRKYSMNGPCIQIYSESTGGGGGGYIAPSTSGGSNSSGTSTYNSHEATCRGCNGSGLCQHCGGSGYVNNYKSKCSLCHGSGRCRSCAGTGKIHGNF